MRDSKLLKFFGIFSLMLFLIFSIYFQIGKNWNNIKIVNATDDSTTTESTTTTTIVPDLTITTTTTTTIPDTTITIISPDTTTTESTTTTTTTTASDSTTTTESPTITTTTTIVKPIIPNVYLKDEILKNLHFSSSVKNIKINIDKNKKAKIDIFNFNFVPPAGSGEIELYALPDYCLGNSLSEIKHNLLTYPYCGDPIGFSISRPNDYNWSFQTPTRIVLGYCEDKNIDCGDNPERFKIIFISGTIIPGSDKIIDVNSIQ